MTCDTRDASFGRCLTEARTAIDRKGGANPRLESGTTYGKMARTGADKDVQQAALDVSCADLVDSEYKRESRARLARCREPVGLCRFGEQAEEDADEQREARPDDDVQDGSGALDDFSRAGKEKPQCRGKGDGDEQTDA